jgi:Tol biopolymer transport system component
VAPDGRHVAVQRAEARNTVSGRDLWVGDLARGIFDRLTTGENFQQLPIWSSDSREIICSTNGKGGGGLYSVSINGGEKALLVAGTLFPSDVTSDGKWLIYTQRGETTRQDIWMLPLADGRAAGAPHVVVNSPYDDVHARVSPNGRWMVYSSDVSGVNEIYVRSLTPAGLAGEPIRVSTGGGSRPTWSRDGRELYYTMSISGDIRVEMVAVPVRIGGAAFEFDAAMPRFKVAIPEQAVPVLSDYDVMPDGRFLVGTGTPDTLTPPATIIFNWTEALKK